MPGRLSRGVPRTLAGALAVSLAVVAALLAAPASRRLALSLGLLLQ